MTVILARFYWLAIGFILIKFEFLSGDINVQTIKRQDVRSFSSKNSSDPNAFLHGNIYEKKEATVVHLNHIATTLLELKSHLTNQQVEFVKPIKQKVDYLKNILDAFRLFYSGATINKNANVIASSVRINQQNTVARIQLNAERIKVTMDKLKMTNLNLRSQIDVEHQIQKRSITEATRWSGNLLQVNKLSVLGRRAGTDYTVKPINKRDSVHSLLGKLQMNRLMVRKLLRTQNETFNGMRTKRSLPSLDHPKIIAQTINNIDWNEFLSTVFRKGINTVISGNLYFSKALNAVYLLIDETANGSFITDLMTLSTDQIVESNVYIPEIMTDGDVNARIFNNMKYFANNVALIGRDNAIDSRIKVFVCNVNSQLKLSDDEGESMTEHIVGTHMDDLTQIYNGRVRIKGSANVNNIYISQDPSQFAENPIGVSQLRVNGIQFDLLNISQQYWMKTVNQDIKHVTFNEPIVSSQATVTTVNGTMVNQYFSVLHDAASLPIFVDFGSPVTIKGNLFSDQLSAPTTLQKLSNDSVVRLGGTQVTMDSPIIFKERLLVNHIDMQVEDSSLVRKSLNTMDDGHVIRKGFKRLTISGNIIMPNNMSIVIRNFNEYSSLKTDLESIITTLDKSLAQLISQSPVIFENVCTAQTVHVENANFIETVQRINQNYDINGVLQNVSRVREHCIQPLLIDGLVRFVQNPELKNSQHVSTLNGLEFSRYMETVILSPVDHHAPETLQKSFEISGEKSFITELNIKSAHTLEINKRIQTNKWLEDAFRKQQAEMHAQQTIDSPGWQFNDVTSDNFGIQSTINGIQIVADGIDPTAKNIIFVDDNSSKTLTIVSDISISNDAQIGSNSKLETTELRPCNVLTLIPKTVHLMQRYWNEVHVIGNVKVVDKQLSTKQCTTPFCYFQMALLSGTEETINTNIVFNLIDSHGKFSFNQIIMWSTNETTLMNNINLLDIFNDAITRTPVLPSNIGEAKTFIAPKELIGSEIIFYVSDALSSNEFTVNLINDINVNYLNRTLYLQSTTREMIVYTWQKILFLDAPIVRTITLRNQSINGVDVSTILFAHSNQSASLVFQNQINELNTKYTGTFIGSGTVYVSLVNGISFEYFIDNRCKLSNNPYATNKPQTIEGYYTFENLILTGEHVAVEQINDVPCDEMVLKQSKEKQSITGDKRIEGDYSQLFIEKPFHVWKTNRFEFVAIFAKSILLDHKQSIERLEQQSPYQLNAQRAYVRL
ncbi:uncharacterized protein LOC129578933 [Sitodiplosis mosellana]|uniref:uncharacterized protein LOC129578933 n=1 Tax=Sitodiplosis mosellana TaxID=263140 RepID=UPI002443984D|nr:uncharacterized protein LOC129578933 [Sitodiplosis mosellana]